MLKVAQSQKLFTLAQIYTERWQNTPEHFLFPLMQSVQEGDFNPLSKDLSQSEKKTFCD